MTDLVCARLDERAVLRVAGPEARDFLQGLVTNDLGRLSPERAIYAALLTPQGKYLFDFVLAQDGEAILIDTERARAPELRQRLLMYRLRARVTVEEPAADLAVLALFGPEAAARLGLPPSPGAAMAERDELRLVDPRLAELGARVILPEREAAPFAASLGVGLADPDAYDRHRLALGVPEGGRDLVPQRSILLESGFEELHGVSFEKGCFVGQELTARTKHRGLVKRRLFPVLVEGRTPVPGTPVVADGQDAGEMRSARDGRGIALLRLEHAGAAVRGETGLRAGEARLSPEIPPWMAIPAHAKTTIG